jgi:hypothetical protein
MENCCAQILGAGQHETPGSPTGTPTADPSAATAPALPKGLRFRDRPLFLLSIIIAVVAVGEYGVMLALAEIPFFSGRHGALIDSLVLVGLAFPALLLLVVRPLRKQIARRMENERVLRETIEELERSKSEIRQLRGLLPICASCKRIRDVGGQWALLEQYIEAHTDASVTHSICPECVRKLYPDHDAGRHPQESDGGDV